VSALRISRPGEPVQLVDLGPAVGRIIHSRGPVYGSVAVSTVPVAKVRQTAEAVREYNRAYYQRTSSVVRCGKWMEVAGESCARRSGHKKEHQTRATMKKSNARHMGYRAR